MYAAINPITSYIAETLHGVKVVVLILGTTKILYMRELRLFAMHICTKSVRTYIAKSPKRTIYVILYNTKVLLYILASTAS